MSRPSFACLCILAVSIGGGAVAQGLDPSRTYLKGFGGAEFSNGFDGAELARTGHGLEDVSYRFDYDTGYVLGAAIGYFASPRVAVEFEYVYRRSYAVVTGVTTLGLTANEFTFDERVTVQSGMVNLLYHFEGSARRAGRRLTSARVLGSRASTCEAPVAPMRPSPGRPSARAAYAINDHWSLVGELRWFSTEGGTFIEFG